MQHVLIHQDQVTPQQHVKTFKVTQTNGNEVFRATKTIINEEQLRYSKRATDLEFNWPSKKNPITGF